MGKRADHRRDRRRPARRRDRDRVRAARPRVRRLHGHRGHAPPAARTCSGWSCSARASSRSTPARDAQGGGLGGDPRLGDERRDTHYMIGSCVGPAPYPAIVRDLQRVIGDEARAQMLEREGRLPARVIACVGGGSNAIGRSPRSSPTRGRADRRRGRRRGDRHRPPRRAADRRRAPGRPARLALGGDAGRGRPDPRGALDLGRARLPGSGPEHAWLRDSGRARYEAVTDARRSRRSASSRAWRASSRRSRPRTRSRGRSRTRTASSTSSACPAAATRISPRCSRRA
jgi:hypothetical protein